jgi:hypothetical protein
VFSLGPRGLSLSRSTFSALCRSNLASHSFWSPLVNANDSSLSVCQATMPRTGRAPRSIGRTQRRARCRCYGALSQTAFVGETPLDRFKKRYSFERLSDKAHGADRECFVLQMIVGQGRD